MICPGKRFFTFNITQKTIGRAMATVMTAKRPGSAMVSLTLAIALVAIVEGSDMFIE